MKKKNDKFALVFVCSTSLVLVNLPLPNSYSLNIFRFHNRRRPEPIQAEVTSQIPLLEAISGDEFRWNVRQCSRKRSEREFSLMLTPLSSPMWRWPPSVTRRRPEMNIWNTPLFIKYESSETGSITTTNIDYRNLGELFVEELKAVITDRAAH